MSDCQTDHINGPVTYAICAHCGDMFPRCSDCEDDLYGHQPCDEKPPPPRELPTAPGSVIKAKPPGRKKAFLMALQENGWWRRLDSPMDERGPFRDVTVLFDAGVAR